MTKRKILVAVAIAILLVMPMLLQNHIVNTIRVSSDMEAHLGVISGSNGYSYYGQVILAWLLKPFVDNPHLPSIYLWLNFVAILGVAATLYYVTKELVNENSAMLVVLVTLFCATGIFALFQYGVIFNIVNMYIILPFAVLFAVWWLTKGKWWIYPSVALFALFSVFHYSALYLPYIVGVSLAVFLVYSLVKKRHQPLKKAIPFGVGLIMMNIYLSGLAINSAGSMQQQTTSSVVEKISPAAASSVAPQPPVVSVSSLELVYNHLTIMTVSLAILAILGVIIWHKKFNVNNGGKVTAALIVCAIISLFGGLLLLAISDFNRIALDLSSLIAIATAVFLGIVWRTSQNAVYKGLVCLFVFMGVAQSAIVWCRL